ncbi:MAG TPA: hypothetical protein V6C76_01615 [Drouetiella sp.]
MCWARVRRPVGETAVNSRFTDEEKRNYAAACKLLKEKVIATAIMIGQGNLEGMERSVAEIRLRMVLEQSSVPGFVSPSDRYHALRWFNWAVELINETRRVLGQPILLIQSGFKTPLVSGSIGGW